MVLALSDDHFYTILNTFFGHLFGGGGGGIQNQPKTIFRPCQNATPWNHFFTIFTILLFLLL